MSFAIKAASLKETMNESVDPCDDFYRWFPLKPMRAAKPINHCAPTLSFFFSWNLPWRNRFIETIKINYFTWMNYVCTRKFNSEFKKSHTFSYYTLHSSFRHITITRNSAFWLRFILPRFLILIRSRYTFWIDNSSIGSRLSSAQTFFFAFFLLF